MNEEQQTALTAFAATFRSFDYAQSIEATNRLQAAFDAQFHRVIFAHSNIMWNRLVMVKNTGGFLTIPFAPAINAPSDEAVKILADKTFIQVENLVDALNNIAGIYAKITEEHGHLYLNELHLSPSFRGNGLGSKLLKVISRYAQQQNLVLNLNILADGDGYYQADDKEFDEYALSHRLKLHKFYLRNGFIINPLWSETRSQALTEAILPDFLQPYSAELPKMGEYVLVP